MSDKQQEMQEQSEQDPGADLSNALSSGDSEFVATEEKKPVVSQGMLYLLALIAIGGGGTYLMYKRSGPATAQAASAETAQAGQTIDNFLNTGPAGIKAMKESLESIEAIKKEFLEYPSVQQIPLADLRTNPFRFSKADGGTVDQDAAKKKKEEDKLATQKAAEGLMVQSVVVNGSRSACMINNKMYNEGQQIDGFTIEKISREGVIVKNTAFRISLPIHK